MTDYEDIGGTATYWPTAHIPDSGEACMTCPQCDSRASIIYLADHEGARAICSRCSWEWRP